MSKVYFVVFDTLPFLPQLVEIAKERGVHLLRHVSQCFTLSSWAAQLTGCMPSDVEPRGIGEHTYRKYRDSKKQVRFPWEKKTLLRILQKEGWEIRIHNGEHFFHYLSGYRGFERTTSYPGGIKKEDSRGWELPEIRGITLGSGPDSDVFWKLEKDWVKKMQAEKPAYNQFYFIRYCQYHDVYTRTPIENAELVRSRLYDLMRAWDFSEPDALFWLHSDHGPWRDPDLVDHPLADHYFTWVLFKDNILVPSPIVVKSPYIHCRDFFATFIKKWGYNVPVSADISSISDVMDQDRVYFVEDGRVRYDENSSTLAMALKFVQWQNGKPQGIKQVSFFVPKREWSCVLTSLDEGGFVQRHTQVDVIDSTLKEALIKRFNWPVLKNQG